MSKTNSIVYSGEYERICREELGCIESHYAGFNKRNLQAYSRREELVKRYAWAIPSVAAIECIRKYAPIIEIGAGTGYWASLIGNIVAYDEQPFKNFYCSGESYFPVLKGSFPVIEEYPNHTLFLCWPPMDDFAYDCLWTFTKRSEAQHFIFVGELGGCTGNEAFWNLIESHWEEIENLSIPKYIGIRDHLYVYSRKALDQGE